MSRDTSYVLALAPVSRGLGVFVIDGSGRPIDWRVREVRGFHKNARCQHFTDELLDEFQPVALVIEDHRANIMKKLGARNAADLVRIAISLGFTAEEATDVPSALARLRQSERGAYRLLITGSLYLAGHVLALDEGVVQQSN